MIGCFPDPYPDELLYGIYTRYADRMGYPSRSAVCRDLFGNRYSANSIDLPNRLGNLVDSLPPRHHYSVDRLIDDHTLLPLHGAFFPTERIRRCRDYMRGDGGQGTALHAGLGFGCLFSLKWLRFCPLCAEEDRANFGETYWHRIHQVPGVEVCPAHEVWLEQSSVVVRSPGNRIQFVAAENEIQDRNPRALDSSNSSSQVLLHLARDFAWLGEQRGSAFDPETMRKRYKMTLVDCGLATFRGWIRLPELSREFKARYPPSLLRLVHCGFDEDVRIDWLSRLLSGSYPIYHPVRHLLLIHFLGYTLEKFIGLPTEYRPFGEGPWPCLNPVCDHYRQPVISHVEVSFQKTADGRPVGIFACECGFVYSRAGPDQSLEDRFRRNSAARTYGTVWEKKLVSLWQNPDLTQEQIGCQLGISDDTVRAQAVRLGLAVPRPAGSEELTDLPIQPRQRGRYRPPRTEKREACRAEWLAAREANPSLSMSELVRKYQRTRDWLYKNDREWLKANTPPRRKRTFKPKVDWKSRDEELAEKVRRSAMRLKSNPGRPVRVCVNEIGRDIGVKALRCYEFDKLPLTVEALAEVVETNEMYYVRRVWWTAECYRKQGIHPMRSRLILEAAVWVNRELPRVKEAIEAALQMLSQLEPGDASD